MNSMTPKNITQVQYTAGKRRKAYVFSFKKKDSIIKNIEIIVACIVAFVAGTGMYELFK